MGTSNNPVFVIPEKEHGMVITKKTAAKQAGRSFTKAIGGLCIHLDLAHVKTLNPWVQEDNW